MLGEIKSSVSGPLTSVCEYSWVCPKRQRFQGASPAWDNIQITVSLRIRSNQDYDSGTVPMLQGTWGLQWLQGLHKLGRRSSTELHPRPLLCPIWGLMRTSLSRIRSDKSGNMFLSNTTMETALRPLLVSLAPLESLMFVQSGLGPADLLFIFFPPRPFIALTNILLKEKEDLYNFSIATTIMV